MVFTKIIFEPKFFFDQKFFRSWNFFWSNIDDRDDFDQDLYIFLVNLGEFMEVLVHVLCIGMIVATAFLFYVVTTKDDKFLLSPIWFLPLDFLGRIIFSLFLIINTGLAYPVSLTHMVPFFLVIIFDVVFWLCVCSYRKQLISTNEKPPSCSDVMCYVKSSKTPFMI